MGTNYYARFNVCPHCDRYDELHIGKNSAGWQFGFHGTENIRSWAQWQEELKEAVIVDEYGTHISFAEFKKLVESKQEKGNFNHYDYCKKEGLTLTYDWKDPEGYSFSEREFS